MYGSSLCYAYVFSFYYFELFSGFYGVFWRRERERSESGKNENETVAAVSFFVLLFWTFFGVLWGFLRRKRRRNENETMSKAKKKSETITAETPRTVRAEAAF